MREFLLLVTERQCTSERWARELLADGCLSYMKSYWCMCSSDMCNGADLESIRGLLFMTDLSHFDYLLIRRI